MDNVSPLYKVGDDHGVFVAGIETPTLTWRIRLKCWWQSTCCRWRYEVLGKYRWYRKLRGIRIKGDA